MFILKYAQYICRNKLKDTESKIRSCEDKIRDLNDQKNKLNGGPVQQRRDKEYHSQTPWASTAVKDIFH